MESKLFKCCSAVLSFLIALLGFGGCDVVNSGDEYGTPYATYKIRGTAVDKATEEPVAGLRAVIYTKQVYDDGEQVTDSDTVKTDLQGEFDLKLDAFSHDNIYLRVEAFENAATTYKAQDVKVDYAGINASGGKGWYEGERVKNLGKIEMEEIPPTTEPE